jgi:hypothetical protein
MSQTDYSNQSESSATKSVKGGLADIGVTNKVTRASASAIDFGVGLAIANTGLVALPAAASFVFDGVSIMKHKAQSNADNLAKYDAREAISVLRKGRIWVYSEQAVNPTLAVYLRHTANGGNTPGNFRVDADTAKADQITTAKWVSVTTGAGLAILEVNLP